ncbi:MAG TPA: RNA methyltransferase [Aggregatilineales bacterium]|jgi:TrmH family RNA methyltransferase|nr:RNA methyltransferase [Aggregatilineales bacterium]
MDIITSLKNDKVKLTNGLQTRARTRRKERKIVLEGTRLIRDALERGHKPVFVLFEPSTVDPDLLVDMQEDRLDLQAVNREVMAYISDTEQSQGVTAVFPMPFPPLPRAPQRVLILDNVRDPGNVGGTLRTAAAAGVHVVVLSPGCADPYNPKTLRAGMGAHFRVPVAEASWEEIGAYCERLDVYLADGSGQTDYATADFTRPWALVIGNEANGIGPEAQALNGTAVRIPMAAATESLNAGVAAGVILFEAARQARLASKR